MLFLDILLEIHKKIFKKLHACYHYSKIFNSYPLPQCGIGLIKTISNFKFNNVNIIGSAMFKNSYIFLSNKTAMQTRINENNTIKI